MQYYSKITFQVCFADSCINNRWKCNCDANVQYETSDEGFLTEKEKLPVTELQFGDLHEEGEQGWFTLGPLICSGGTD